MKDKDVQASIIESLDGDEARLFPHLPHLLQDVWEIGASPRHLIELIEKSKLAGGINSALDLGCGKGAVSIQLAKRFGWRVSGIDAMPAFINEANERSREHGTVERCTFEVDDIREAVHRQRGYSLVILGSIGPVLGSIGQTLNAVKQCLTNPGYVLLDDGYKKGKVTTSMHDIPDRAQALAEIVGNGFDIIDEFIYDPEEIKASDVEIFESIKRRALELQLKYPQEKAVLEKYIQDQIRENYVLENEYVCVTWLLKLANA